MSLSEIHREQLITAKRERKTEEQLKTEHIERVLNDKSDRHLMEEQVYRLRHSEEHLKSIKKNVQFFFWITIIGIAAWAIGILVAGAPYEI